MELIKVHVVEKSKLGTKFQAGDRVTDKDYGVGIIVGFGDITGNPLVYFYDVQREFNGQAVCVDITTIRPAPTESAKGGKEMSTNIKATLDITNLDDVLGKTTRIVELLQEAQQIVESLSGEKQSSPNEDLNTIRCLSETQAQELFQRSQEKEEADEKMTVREMLEKQLHLLSEQDMIAINVNECCRLNAAICETARVLMDAIIHDV